MQITALIILLVLTVGRADGLESVRDSSTRTVVAACDTNGALLKTNDSWQLDAGATELLAAGLAPKDANEAAILTPLPPGAYTTIVRGHGTNTGVALVEAYNLP